MEENVQSTIEHGIAEQRKSTCSDEKGGLNTNTKYRIRKSREFYRAWHNEQSITEYITKYMIH